MENQSPLKHHAIRALNSESPEDRNDVLLVENVTTLTFSTSRSPGKE